MGTPTVTLCPIHHYLGDDPVTYEGKDGRREFKPRAYEVLVDGEVVGRVSNGKGYRETSSAGNVYVNSRWETTEWNANFTYRNGKRGVSHEHKNRVDAITVVLTYGARLDVGAAGTPTPNDVRPIAKTARVQR